MLGTLKLIDISSNIAQLATASRVPIILAWELQTYTEPSRADTPTQIGCKKTENAAKWYMQTVAICDDIHGDGTNYGEQTMTCAICNKPCDCGICDNCYDSIIAEQSGLANERNDYYNWLDSMEARQQPQELPEDYTY